MTEKEKPLKIPVSMLILSLPIVKFRESINGKRLIKMAYLKCCMDLSFCRIKSVNNPIIIGKIKSGKYQNSKLKTGCPNKNGYMPGEICFARYTDKTSGINKNKKRIKPYNPRIYFSLKTNSNINTKKEKIDTSFNN